MAKRICYIRGLSKGGRYIVEGDKTGKKYEFTFNKPCLEIGTEFDENDVYGFLQKVKRELGSCGGCGGKGGKKEVTYQVFALRN